jgi:hypothetical protein
LYSPKSAGEKRLILAILVLSGLILLVLSIYYVITPRSIVGDALVNNPSGNPLEVPPPGTFFFYVKPVTILFASLIVFSFCGFTLLGGVMSRIPRSLSAFLLVVSVLGLAVSAYEVLFNFTLWAALLASTHSNPDSIVNAYPVSSYKINLAFATKSFVALLFISYFALTTFRNSLDSSNY